MEQKLLMTSGYSFEGYTISQYLGVYSGECALGTGFLSTLGASFADFFGTNSTMYSDKLKKAKDFAINQLVEQVTNAGGDAIIGLDIDYVSFSADIMGVVATGTAVKLCSTLSQPEADQKYTISTTNAQLPFRATSLHVNTSISTGCLCSLELFHMQTSAVSAVLTDITFTDIFYRETTIKDIAFTGFKPETARNLMSDPVICNVSSDIFRLLDDIKLTVKKYVTEEGLVSLSEDEIEYSSINDCKEDSKDFVSELLLKAGSLDSAKAIYDYVVEYSKSHVGAVDPNLIALLEKQKSIERFYGNHKNDTIEALKKYFEQKES